MNDMNVLLDLMRGWLALVNVGATLLWLLSPRGLDAEDRAQGRGHDCVDTESNADRLGANAARSAPLSGRLGVSLSVTTPPAPTVAIWYPELLDLHTGQPIHAGARSDGGA
jgi:hypothetical protein